MSSAKSSSSNLGQQADATVDELKALIREAEHALSDTGDLASDKIRELRGRFRDALDEGRGRVKDLADQARRQAARADEMIHENPYPAIGIAVGVGVIAGYLIARGCSNSGR